MAPSIAASASDALEFLAQQPPERRAELARVLDTVRRNLKPGFEEHVGARMIVFQVPRERCPNTYNGQPLMYAAIAAPKSYLTLHLMPLYMNPKLLARLRAGFTAEGKKLDIGKACIRFKRADDLALDSIGEIVATLSADQWVAYSEAARETARPSARKKPAKRKR